MKPREWYLNPVANYWCDVDENGISKTANEVHVIEKKAYNDLKKRADKLYSSIKRVIAWESEEGCADWSNVHEAIKKYEECLSSDVSN